ncbi:helix-turn-helix domain-containing protein [Massilia sp. IC2-476]|uniref:winged helix-turn-helix transcriptional regulator n=1 Tax=Massilia sp. IC2-476 TaxID=2887199 RepID=UPI001D127DC9|nr:helix-turn-helix domain-containing protein [Massilia sp. IC2-476]MCC2970928.1 helix-turn-helix transcriptional regulator [Massilia sp. IC2-476]
MTTPEPISSEPCPVARSVNILGDRWSLLIVRDAFDGIGRFSEFQRSLGAARNILADRLRRLVDGGILATRPAGTGSAYQEYVLTEAGKSLFPVVVALRQWGERNLFMPGEAHSELIEKKTGKPVQLMSVRTEDGGVLGPDDAEVRKLALSPGTDT